MLNSLLKIGSVVLAADEIKTNIQNQKLKQENPNAELKSSIADKACDKLVKGAGLLLISAFDALREF